MQSGGCSHAVTITSQGRKRFKKCGGITIPSTCDRGTAGRLKRKEGENHKRDDRGEKREQTTKGGGRRKTTDSLESWVLLVD